MEQATGSIMTGVRAFSAHQPLTSLLWPYTALRLFVYFQVNTGVLTVLISPDTRWTHSLLISRSSNAGDQVAWENKVDTCRSPNSFHLTTSRSSPGLVITTPSYSELKYRY